MNNRILIVDDEPGVLRSLARLLQDEPFELRTAPGAREAEALLRRQEFALVLSDNLMPGMKGTEFLQEVKDRFPDTVRMLMTGCADLQTAVEAINRSGIFRFIVKPWGDGFLVDTIKEGVERFNLKRRLHSADEATLLSIAKTVELKDPYTRGHSERVARYALSIAEELALDTPLLREIRQGSWLHDCGKIGIPEHILQKKDRLSPEEYAIMQNHPRWGAEVAREAQLSRGCIDIILCHHERLDGSGYPEGRAGDEIPLAARIVAVADVYDALATRRPYAPPMSDGEACRMLESMKGAHLDPELVDTFLLFPAEMRANEVMQ